MPESFFHRYEKTLRKVFFWCAFGLSAVAAVFFLQSLIHNQTVSATERSFSDLFVILLSLLMLAGSFSMLAYVILLICYQDDSHRRVGTTVGLISALCGLKASLEGLDNNTASSFLLAVAMIASALTAICWGVELFYHQDITFRDSAFIIKNAFSDFSKLFQKKETEELIEDDVPLRPSTLYKEAEISLAQKDSLPKISSGPRTRRKPKIELAPAKSKVTEAKAGEPAKETKVKVKGKGVKEPQAVADTLEQPSEEPVIAEIPQESLPEDTPPIPEVQPPLSKHDYLKEAGGKIKELWTSLRSSRTQQAPPLMPIEEEEPVEEELPKEPELFKDAGPIELEPLDDIVTLSQLEEQKTQELIPGETQEVPVVSQNNIEWKEPDAPAPTFTKRVRGFFGSLFKAKEEPQIQAEEAPKPRSFIESIPTVLPPSEPEVTEIPIPEAEELPVAEELSADVVIDEKPSFEEQIKEEEEAARKIAAALEEEEKTEAVVADEQPEAAVVEEAAIEEIPVEEAAVETVEEEQPVLQEEAQKETQKEQLPPEEPVIEAEQIEETPKPEEAEPEAASTEVIKEATKAAGKAGFGARLKGFFKKMVSPMIPKDDEEEEAAAESESAKEEVPVEPEAAVVEAAMLGEEAPDIQEAAAIVIDAQAKISEPEQPVEQEVIEEEKPTAEAVPVEEQPQPEALEAEQVVASEEAQAESTEPVEASKEPKEPEALETIESAEVTEPLEVEPEDEAFIPSEPEVFTGELPVIVIEAPDEEPPAAEEAKAEPEAEIAQTQEEIPSEPAAEVSEVVKLTFSQRLKSLFSRKQPPAVGVELPAEPVIQAEAPVEEIPEAAETAAEAIETISESADAIPVLEEEPDVVAVEPLEEALKSLVSEIKKPIEPEVISPVSETLQPLQPEEPVLQEPETKEQADEKLAEIEEEILQAEEQEIRQEAKEPVPTELTGKSEVPEVVKTALQKRLTRLSKTSMGVPSTPLPEAPVIPETKAEEPVGTLPEAGIEPEAEQMQVDILPAQPQALDIIRDEAITVEEAGPEKKGLLAWLRGSKEKEKKQASPELVLPEQSITTGPVEIDQDAIDVEALNVQEIEGGLPPVLDDIFEEPVIKEEPSIYEQLKEKVPQPEPVKEEPKPIAEVIKPVQATEIPKEKPVKKSEGMFSWLTKTEPIKPLVLPQDSIPQEITEAPPIRRGRRKKVEEPVPEPVYEEEEALPKKQSGFSRFFANNWQTMLKITVVFALTVGIGISIYNYYQTNLKPIYVDIFEGMEVGFFGINGEGKAEIVSFPKKTHDEKYNSFLDETRFVLSIENGLSNGDVITITAYVNEKLQKQNRYVIDNLTMTVTVTGLSSLVYSPADITNYQDVVSLLDQSAYDLFEYTSMTKISYTPKLECYGNVSDIFVGDTTLHYTTILRYYDFYYSWEDLVNDIRHYNYGYVVGLTNILVDEYGKVNKSPSDVFHDKLGLKADYNNIKNAMEQRGFSCQVLN
ncbi:MAG: hypothetical protein LBR25_09950 [Erysipelotrichaceae bacterium]|jgi:hypothetical protein|nr:hypothetical protein [Erysipelotrichaceae bacterium]